MSKDIKKDVMTIPTRIARAALSGAIFFIAFWGISAAWDGYDHGRTDTAAIGAVIVMGLAFLRTYWVERLDRRNADVRRPTFRSIIGAINTIIRKPNQ